MAEAQKLPESGFDLGKIFTAIGNGIKNTYTEIEFFIDQTGPPKVGLQFTPYYVFFIFAIFFFIWMPLHPEANALWGAVFIALVPFVLPFLTLRVMMSAFHDLSWLRDYHRRDYCLLEIKLPTEITQGPFAMELVIRGLYQTGDHNTWWDKFSGITKAWFSLEIVSTEGRVRFFMWGRRQYKELMENQIYAHYPTVQVVEVEDYTLQVPFDPDTMNLWGVEQAMQKPDPYPILTYNEFQTIDPTTKEEFKSDPLAAIIEFLGSMGEGEHIWMQFIVRAHEPKSTGGYCPYSEGVEDEKKNIIRAPIALAEWAQIEVNKILTSVRGEDTKAPVNFTALTKGQRDAIESIQTKLNKQPFDTGIRSLYIAQKDKFRSAPRTAIPSAFRSFEHGSSGRGLNGLRPIFWVGPFNFPWQDFRGIRRVMIQRRFYNAFAMREFFFPPHKHRWVVLNSEELATLYHFPGRVVATPNLERRPSRRAEAPANLPI